jgi:hypothetical protein
LHIGFCTFLPVLTPFALILLIKLIIRQRVTVSIVRCIVLVLSFAAWSTVSRRDINNTPVTNAVSDGDGPAGETQDCGCLTTQYVVALHCALQLLTKIIAANCRRCIRQTSKLVSPCNLHINCGITQRCSAVCMAGNSQVVGSFGLQAILDQETLIWIKNSALIDASSACCTRLKLQYIVSAIRKTF